MPSQTDVVSFVLRFVRETTNGPAASTQGKWYGLIRHVQTEDEGRFTCLVDLVTFISRYVDLADLALAGNVAENEVGGSNDTRPTK